MQTSREVIQALLTHQKAERVGIFDSPWEDTTFAWVQQGYPTRVEHHEAGENYWRPEDGRWVEAEKAGEYLEPVPAWEHFGFDLSGIGPWFDAMPIADCDELVSETDEWDVRRNGAGAALKFWKHKNGTPEHIDFRMVTRQIWEKDYRPFMQEISPSRFKLPELTRSFNRSKKANVWTHFGHMFVWEFMRQSMGDVTLYQNLILDPDWIRDYNRVYTDFFKKAFTYLFEHVGLPDGVWLYEDLGYKNGLFASPKILNELIFPYYHELVDFFHSYQLPVVLHSCGSVVEALPLIVEAGFDALNPMERKAKGNDPFLFAEKYGDKLAFVGGLDTRIFDTNDKETIRKEIVAYIQGMKARGARLIFASDHSITPATRYDTYRYAVEVYKENMLY